MPSYASRAVRWTLALALPALAACTGEPTPTGPALPQRPNLIVGNVITVTTASGGREVGSIRWATSVAADFDVIRFDPSLDGAMITLDSTLLVTSSVTIEGPQTRGITLSGNDRIRVVHLYRGAIFKNLTITRGYHPVTAGGIYGTTAGITLEHSTVSNNSSPGVGGISTASVWLTNSTVAQNSGGAYASGIYYDATYGSFNLNNSTVAQNQPAPGIASYGTPSTTMIQYISNSIIANNGVPLRNCQNVFIFDYFGTNISDDATCGGASVMTIADPKLGTLADHGGPSATIDFAPQSPAFNGGVACSVTVDQRYVPRDTYCDVGALEFNDWTVVTLTIDPNATVNTTTGSAIVTGTVKCSRNGDQFGVVVDLQQQKSGKTPATVQGTGGAAVNCTTAAQAWSATVVPASGAFDSGSAAATARTNDTSIWITPASTSKAVKLARARK
jgi:hypothetical protein